MKNYDVVCFGSAIMDMFVSTYLNEKFVKGSKEKDFKTISYPTGMKILVKGLKLDIGGGGTNTATAFSRLGLKTAHVGKIGDDQNGKIIINFLKKEKIDFLGKIAKGVTGQSIVLCSKKHNRTILTYRGLNNFVKMSDIKSFKTKWLYLSSLLGQSYKTQINLARKLSAEGVKIAFNPSEYLIKRKNLTPIIGLLEVLIVNFEEAKAIVKKETSNQKKLLASLYKKGPKIVVITNGDKEMVAYDGKNFYTLKPNKVKVVERTGAGDAFAAGFVAGQIIGSSIPESLKLGLKESESVIGHFGAKNKLLRMKLKK